MTPRSVFSYRNGVLCVEALPLAELAEEIDTPFFCLSAKQIQRNMRGLAAPFGNLKTVFYHPMGAHTGLAALRFWAEQNGGVAVSSAGGVERALEAGIGPQRILFSGVGKTRDDLAACLLSGVSQVEAHTVYDLCLMDHVAAVLGQRVPVTLALNLGNAPDHPFGFDLESLAAALHFICTRPSFSLKALSVRLGGEETLVDSCRTLASVATLVREQGVPLRKLNIMGWRAAFGAAAAPLLADCFGALGCSLAIGTDRHPVDDACVLVSRVLDLHPTRQGTIVVTDATAFQAPVGPLAGREILPLREGTEAPTPVTVRGLGGEGGTILLEEGGALPPLSVGDLLAFVQAGAEGEGALFGGESRSFAAEALVSGAQYAVVRRRLAVAEQMIWEAVPDWMAKRRAA